MTTKYLPNRELANKFLSKINKTCINSKKNAQKFYQTIKFIKKFEK